MENIKAQRSSNIELLRIISMMLIVSTHLFGKYVDFQGSIYPFPKGYVFFWIVKSITYIAVNMYVVISAYFLCTSKFKSRRVVQTWLEVLFYSVIIGIPGMIITGHHDIKSLLVTFLPVMMSEYWFATVFIGLLILTPFINLSIRAMNEKALRYLCITLFLLFSFIPTFIGPFSRWLAFGGACGLGWFVSLYYFTAYFRLYVSKEKIHQHKKTILALGLISSVLPAILRFVIVLLTQYVLGHPVGGGFFYGNNIFIIAIATFAIFLYFSVLSTPPCISKTINTLAKSSFAVYLIHENPFVIQVLHKYVPQFIYTDSVWFPLQYLAVMLTIWLICTLVDFIRQAIETPIFNRIDFTVIDGKINTICEKE